MTLTKRGSAAKKRRKKILKIAKGFRGSHSRLFRAANQKVMQSLTYSYADRKKKKKQFKSTWIRRINNESRSQNLSYNKLIHKFKKQSIALNRKILSEITIFDSSTFKRIINIK